MMPRLTWRCVGIAPRQVPAARANATTIPSKQTTKNGGDSSNAFPMAALLVALLAIYFVVF